ncbi:MAG: ABC transporter ATP-binding protein [Halorientalis sp.]
MTVSSGPQLAVEDLAISYGDITVVREADMTADEGSVVSIVGANGAGKTTLLKTIAGVKDPDRGSVRFEGEDIVGMAPHEIISRGLVYVPERHQIFPDMTVRDNLLIARSPVQDGDENTMDEVFDLFPILDECRDQQAGTMSGGQQQMLALAQGLAAEPDLLMLDEPTLGLAPQIVEDVWGTIKTISDEGVTILLVDEKVELAQDIADSMYLMREGTLHYLGEEGEFEAAYDEATSGMVE